MKPENDRMHPTCQKNPEKCRTKQEIINYAFYLSRNLAKILNKKIFYLNDVIIVQSTQEFSRFLFSFETIKDNGEGMAFLYK